MHATESSHKILPFLSTTAIMGLIEKEYQESQIKKQKKSLSISSTIETVTHFQD